MNLAPLKDSAQAELEFPLYLAEALGYSIDEFFYIFDRPIYERWAIAEKLYPILEEEYKLEDHLEISGKYRMEVIDEMVKTQS